MHAVADKSWEDRNAIVYRRLIRRLFAIILVGLLWPNGVCVLVVIAGFVLARETLRAYPTTTGESLFVIVALALATTLVLTGPWLGLVFGEDPAAFENLVCLPHFVLLGTTWTDSFLAWLSVVALGTWLTFRYESLWVLAGVLVFALIPLPFLWMYAQAMANA